MHLTKSKKNFIILLGALSLFLFSGAEALAACQLEGIVPCGTNACPCTICHLFMMVGNIVSQILKVLVPVVAVLLVVFSGFLFIIGRGDGSSENVKKGKNALTAVAVGLLIIYGSYIGVNEVLKAVGVKTVWAQGWYQIDCQ